MDAMKIKLFVAGAFALALAMPLVAYAQQGPPASQGYGRSTVPSEAKLQHRWAKRFGNLNLSGDQQQRIQSLIHQYAQSHPEGSPRDPQANRDLRRQIMGQLNGDQQNQYRQEMRARRAQMRQHQGATQGDYQQGAPDERDQQGPPDQYQQGPPGQYQQGPPGQYQQGPPPGQYQQGPPPGQYQQGPPPGQYQQGPPPGQYQQGPPPDQYQQGPPSQ
jgi:hypothetical protein